MVAPSGQTLREYDDNTLLNHVYCQWFLTTFDVSKGNLCFVLFYIKKYLMLNINMIYYRK